MKNFNSYFLPLLLTIVVMQSCSKPDCFESAGATTITNRTASSFNQIDLYDNIDLILTQDTIEKIQVAAGENLQPNIATSIDNNILTIKNNTSCQWLRNPAEKATVYVSVKMLNVVNYNGSGNITSTNTINTSVISFNSKNGAGNVEVTLNAQHAFAYIFDNNADFIFHGKSDAFNSYTNAKGTIDFKDLAVKKLIIEYGAIKDAYINASEEINATIYFKGNLYYKGNPAIVTTQYYSSGKLIHLP